MLRLALRNFSHKKSFASLLFNISLLVIMVNAYFEDSVYSFDSGSWRLL